MCQLRFLNYVIINSHARRRRDFLLTTLIVLSLCCTAYSYTASPALPLHTSGANIVGSRGICVRLNAFTWYGANLRIM
jgi:hypothetical protein